MPVHKFSVPGHSTRREFAVYVAVAKRRESREQHVYIGKTGDNREGCNPVISRAGNHFSYNEIHSQIRNKLTHSPAEYDYEYFYITFAPYSDDKQERTDRIAIINEMERTVNAAIQQAFLGKPEEFFLNSFKGTGFVKASERAKRAALRAPERIEKVTALVNAVVEHVERVG